MGANQRRDEWVDAVRAVASERGLTYEEVGGLNPRDAPAALCPGGSNRITGELADDFWGACCDSKEREEGRLFAKAVLPGAVLIKAHMPDLTEVVPAFDVESIESTPDEQLRRLSSLRVQFESIGFNNRYIATVPKGHDPVALRELFSPGFLDWATTIDHEVDFGALENQLYFQWQLRKLTKPELEAALNNAGELFRRVRRELEGAGRATYPAGPWHAGMAPFPTR